MKVTGLGPKWEKFFTFDSSRGQVCVEARPEYLLA